MCTPAAVSATWLLSPTYSPVRSWRMSWTPEPRNLWPSVRCDRHWHYASARTRTLSRPGCPITRAGSQYTPTHLRRLLAVHQIDGSIGTVGDAYDNGLMESTIGLYKSELIDFEAETWTNWGGGGRWNAPQPDGSTGTITSGCIPRSGISRRSSTTPTTNEKTTQAFTPRNTPLSKSQADSQHQQKDAL